MNEESKVADAAQTILNAIINGCFAEREMERILLSARDACTDQASEPKADDATHQAHPVAEDQADDTVLDVEKIAAAAWDVAFRPRSAFNGLSGYSGEIRDAFFAFTRFVIDTVKAATTTPDALTLQPSLSDEAAAEQAWEEMRASFTADGSKGFWKKWSDSPRGGRDEVVYFARRFRDLAAPPRSEYRVMEAIPARYVGGDRYVGHEIAICVAEDGAEALYMILGGGIVLTGLRMPFESWDLRVTKWIADGRPVA